MIPSDTPHFMGELLNQGVEPFSAALITRTPPDVQSKRLPSCGQIGKLFFGGAQNAANSLLNDLEIQGERFAENLQSGKDVDVYSNHVSRPVVRALAEEKGEAFLGVLYPRFLEMPRSSARGKGKAFRHSPPISSSPRWTKS